MLKSACYVLLWSTPALSSVPVCIGCCVCDCISYVISTGYCVWFFNKIDVISWIPVKLCECLRDRQGCTVLEAVWTVNNQWPFVDAINCHRPKINKVISLFHLRRPFGITGKGICAHIYSALYWASKILASSLLKQQRTLVCLGKEQFWCTCSISLSTPFALKIQINSELCFLIIARLSSFSLLVPGRTRLLTVYPRSNSSVISRSRPQWSSPRCLNARYLLLTATKEDEV